MSSPTVKTRILIISDTHGAKPQPAGQDAASAVGFRDPLPEADVVLHCGDLTVWGSPAEYSRTFDMLRAIRAPLKLVIAGNHDTSLDEPFWRKQKNADPTYTAKVHEIINDARQDNVKYLTEGEYTFDLENGAKLRVYASQFTPKYEEWGFQYVGKHDFDIPAGVDIAMTHGPPKRVLDYVPFSNSDAGCEHLFAAVHAAKPMIHCFGHIHEGWGAYLARWKEDSGQPATRELAVDETASKTLQNLDSLSSSAAASELVKQRGVRVDLTQGDDRLVKGDQTLFVNAAIMDVQYDPVQLPWIIDVDLSRS